VFDDPAFNVSAASALAAREPGSRRNALALIFVELRATTGVP
jgi:hypothetical protein